MATLSISLMRNPYSNKLRSGYVGGYVPPLGSGAVYHVAKTGNDTTGTGSLANPFLTIGRAMFVREVGMTIQLHALLGAMTTYRESTDPVDPLYGNPYATKVNMGSTVAAVAPQVSGQLGNQCTLMAYPSDEGLVQIQGADLLGGVHTDGFDYWTLWGLRIVDCFKWGVGSYESNVSGSDDRPGVGVSYGWLVENCFVDNIYTNQLTHAGIDNCSGVSPWGSFNWVIRNCKIRRVYDVSPTKINSGIQAYDAVNCLIEHCDIESDQGIFFKDHFLETTSPRAPYAQESEVRYNRIKSTAAPLYIGVKGANTAESGGHYFHHNICYGTKSSSSGNSGLYFVYAKMAMTSPQQSTTLRIENNIFDRGASTPMTGLGLSDWLDIQSKGNVFINDGALYSLEGFANTGVTPKNYLTYSDYNVFVTSAFKMEMQKNTVSEVTITNFNTWKSKLSGDYPSLVFNNPDAHSTVLTNTAGLFTDISNNDYTPAVGSTLRGFMTDGSNAGAYQTGNEVIGLLSVYSAGS
jgi:hypothetical protein